MISRIRAREPQVRFKGLLLVSILVTATHPLLDWTNNYGTRFLLPWNARWFYGDFTFVLDPYFWMVLGGAAFLLTTKTRRHVMIWLALAIVPSYLVLSSSVGSGAPLAGVLLRSLWIVALIASVTLYRQGFAKLAGPKIAIAALTAVTIYATLLFALHGLALRWAETHAAGIANSYSEQVLRVAAMATAADPTGWVCVLETDRATYRFNLSLLGDRQSSSALVRYEKPSGQSAEKIAEAERDNRAQIFLGFARFPVMRVLGEDCVTQTLVQFADLRYTEPGRGRGTFSLDVPVSCPGVDEQSK
jgi:inner membrane protein